MISSRSVVCLLILLPLIYCNETVGTGWRPEPEEPPRPFVYCTARSFPGYSSLDVVNQYHIRQCMDVVPEEFRPVVAAVGAWAGLMPKCADDPRDDCDASLGTTCPGICILQRQRVFGNTPPPPLPECRFDSDCNDLNPCTHDKCNDDGKCECNKIPNCYEGHPDCHSMRSEEGNSFALCSFARSCVADCAADCDGAPIYDEEHGVCKAPSPEACEIIGQVFCPYDHECHETCGNCMGFGWALDGYCQASCGINHSECPDQATCVKDCDYCTGHAHIYYDGSSRCVVGDPHLCYYYDLGYYCPTTGECTKDCEDCMYNPEGTSNGFAAVCQYPRGAPEKSTSSPETPSTPSKCEKYYCEWNKREVESCCEWCQAMGKQNEDTCTCETGVDVFEGLLHSQFGDAHIFAELLEFAYPDPNELPKRCDVTLLVPVDTVWDGLYGDTQAALFNDRRLARSVVDYHIIDGAQTQQELQKEGSAQTMRQTVTGRHLELLFGVENIPGGQHWVMGTDYYYWSIATLTTFGQDPDAFKFNKFPFVSINHWGDDMNGIVHFIGAPIDGIVNAQPGQSGADDDDANRGNQILFPGRCDQIADDLCEPIMFCSNDGDCPYALQMACQPATDLVRDFFNCPGVEGDTANQVINITSNYVPSAARTDLCLKRCMPPAKWHKLCDGDGGGSGTTCPGVGATDFGPAPSQGQAYQGWGFFFGSDLFAIDTSGKLPMSPANQLNTALPVWHRPCDPAAIALAEANGLTPACTMETTLRPRPSTDLGGAATAFYDKYLLIWGGVSTGNVVNNELWAAEIKYLGDITSWNDPPEYNGWTHNRRTITGDHGPFWGFYGTNDISTILKNLAPHTRIHYDIHVSLTGNHIGSIVKVTLGGTLIGEFAPPNDPLCNTNTCELDLVGEIDHTNEDLEIWINDNLRSSSFEQPGPATGMYTFTVNEIAVRGVLPNSHGFSRDWGVHLREWCVGNSCGDNKPAADQGACAVTLGDSFWVYTNGELSRLDMSGGEDGGRWVATLDIEVGYPVGPIFGTLTLDGQVLGTAAAGSWSGSVAVDALADRQEFILAFEGFTGSEDITINIVDHGNEANPDPSYPFFHSVDSRFYWKCLVGTATPPTPAEWATAAMPPAPASPAATFAAPAANGGTDVYWCRAEIRRCGDHDAVARCLFENCGYTVEQVIANPSIIACENGGAVGPNEVPHCLNQALDVCAHQAVCYSQKECQNWLPWLEDEIRSECSQDFSTVDFECPPRDPYNPTIAPYGSDPSRHITGEGPLWRKYCASGSCGSAPTTTQYSNCALHGNELWVFGGTTRGAPADDGSDSWLYNNTNNELWSIELPSAGNPVAPMQWTKRCVETPPPQWIGGGANVQPTDGDNLAGDYPIRDSNIINRVPSLRARGMMEFYGDVLYLFGGSNINNESSARMNDTGAAGVWKLDLRDASAPPLYNANYNDDADDNDNNVCHLWESVCATDGSSEQISCGSGGPRTPYGNTGFKIGTKYFFVEGDPVVGNTPDGDIFELTLRAQFQRPDIPMEDQGFLPSEQD